MRVLFLLALAAGLAMGQAPEVLEVHGVAGGFDYLEGPAWWPLSHMLLFSDIPTGRVLAYRSGQEVAVFAKDLLGPTGNAFDSHAWLYTCEARAHRLIRRDSKGKVEVVAKEFEGKPLNSPNDVVVRKDGHVYFTDPAFGTADKQRVLPFYGVYHVNNKGELDVIARPKGRPNGIALAPDGKRLYVTNSDERNVRVYDLDRKGDASGERVLVADVDGIPDGMAVDSDGNLYVAANGILIYSKEGTFLRKIELESPPSNCAFGGDDLQSLFVTAQGALYEIRLNVKGSLQY